MNDTTTSASISDDELRAVAAEIRRSAPPPHPWESLGADVVPASDHGRRGGHILIGAAAASIVLLGVVGIMVTVDRGGPAAPSAANGALPASPTEGQPWSPVIEQLTLTAEIDAIAVSSDVGDWTDRAVFPLETPAGFTIDSVSRSVGGDITESGGVDTGDVVVRFITVTPTGSSADASLVIETVPAGIGPVSSATQPEIVTTSDNTRWDVYTEQTPEGSFTSTAYVRTPGPGATVSLTAATSAKEAEDQTRAVLESLRLVRIEEIPTEVIDLNRLPVVATAEPDDAASGFIAAQRTTNSWCIATRIGNHGGAGCGYRIDPRNTPARFVELSYDADGIVTMAGMAAPDVERIEIDLADGSTLNIQPTFPADSVDGIGFWVATHPHDGPIPQQGPVTDTRVFAEDGNPLGKVQAP
jgi:hypothetical protein